jgi:hypothetical protein
MFKVFPLLFKKFVLAGLILTLGLAALPATAAFAASGGTTSTPVPATPNPNQRLQELFADEKATNDRQGDQLNRGGPLISLAVQIIAAAKKHGLNTSNAEAALDRFRKAFIEARLIHDHARDLIVAHHGFDARGFVTDRVKAAQTVADLGKVQENFRQTYYPPFNALVESLRDLIGRFDPGQALPSTLS